jgi:hypothetical protein
MALVTTARAQQNALLATVDSTLLGNLNDTASQMIVNYCDTEFEASSTTTEDLNGNGLDYIIVKNKPITTLTSVIITEDGGSTTTISSGNLQYEANTGIITFDQDNSSSYGLFPKGYLNIRIAYAYGWATIPAPVQEACVQTMVQLYGPSMATTNPQLDSERMGEYSWKRKAASSDINASGFTPMVENMLQPYIHFGGV